MHRLLFSKTADAIWTSHLDVMRIFQRAFLRAHIPIAHTQGYSPHPFVSVILPLSVGTASQCEILECTLEDKEISFQETQERLNQVLPEGIQVKEVYESSRKAKELTYLQARLELCYDSGIPFGASEMLNSLYSRETLEITKKSKKGETLLDIRPMIQSVQVQDHSPTQIWLDTVVCAQNPSCNPLFLVTAIQTYLSQLAPDFVRCSREEVFDKEGRVFR